MLAVAGVILSVAKDLKVLINGIIFTISLTDKALYTIHNIFLLGTVLTSVYYYVAKQTRHILVNHSSNDLAFWLKQSQSYLLLFYQIVAKLFYFKRSIFTRHHNYSLTNHLLYSFPFYKQLNNSEGCCCRNFQFYMPCKNCLLWCWISFQITDYLNSWINHITSNMVSKIY